MAVAFSRGNVFPVAKDLHHRFPGVALVIAGDDDRYTPGNPRPTRRRGGRAGVAGTAIFPDFTGLETARQPTDFNDVHLLGGLAHLKRQLEPTSRPSRPPRPARGTAHPSDRSRTAVRGARC